MAAAALAARHQRRARGDPGWGGDLRRRHRGRVLRPAGLTTFQVGQTYIFAVGNEGQEVHEFVIEPAGSEEAGGGGGRGRGRGERRGGAGGRGHRPGTDRGTGWTFTEPGDFQFACHLLDHYQRGMVVEIEVVE